MTSQDGFFARIIRDALTSLPDATGEHQVLPVEQELQLLTEHSTAHSLPQSDSQTLAQTPDTKAGSDVAQNTALHPSSAADGHRARSAKSLTTFEQNSTALDEQPNAQAAKKVADSLVHNVAHNSVAQQNAVNFPRNTRAMAKQQPPQKMPLSINLRNRAAPSERGEAVTAESAQQSIMSAAPAASAHPPTGKATPHEMAANRESNSRAAELANTTVPRSTLHKTSIHQPTSQGLQTVAPRVAESVPLVNEHRLAERKIATPTLRIGAVTIRVVEAAPPATATNRINPPTSHSHTAAVDPIASAESRHFLRTL